MTRRAGDRRRVVAEREARDVAQEPAVQAAVRGQFGMEAQAHDVALAHADDRGRRAMISTPGPTRASRGARMNTPSNRPPTTVTSSSATNESIWRPYALRSVATSSAPSVA